MIPCRPERLPCSYWRMPGWGTDHHRRTRHNWKNRGSKALYYSVGSGNTKNEIKLTRYLRASSDLLAIPRIMIISQSSEKHCTQVYNASMTLYLPKPFSDDNLIIKLNSLLKQKLIQTAWWKCSALSGASNLINESSCVSGILWTSASYRVCFWKRQIHRFQNNV